MEQTTTTAQLEELLRQDAPVALERARELLDAAGTESDTVAYQSILLIKGAAQDRIGETEDGARVMRGVKAWAEEHGEDALLARSHRRISAHLGRIGDPALMLEHAVPPSISSTSIRPRSSAPITCSDWPMRWERAAPTRTRSDDTRRSPSWPTDLGMGTCGCGC